MKKRLKITLILLLMVTMSLIVTACTKTVVNESMTLHLNGIGEREGTYSGEMNNGLPDGEGKFITKNEAGEEWYYEGSFVAGQFEGKGKQEFTQYKTREVGIFKNSQMISGKTYYNEVIIYKGEYKDDLFMGNGILYNSNGNEIYKGDFKYGIPVDKEQIKNNSEEISFNDLARNDKHIGDIVKIAGEVIQVIEYQDEGNERYSYVEYRIALDDYWEDIIFATYYRISGEERIIEGDNVVVYGTYDGLFTYESTEGANITVPSIIAYYFE